MQTVNLFKTTLSFSYIKDFFIKKSFRNRILTIYLMLVLSIIAVSSFYFSYIFYKSLYQQMNHKVNILTKQSAQMLNESLEVVESITIGFSFSDIIKLWLINNYDIDEIQKHDINYKMTLESSIRETLYYSNSSIMKLIETVSIFINDNYICSVYSRSNAVDKIIKNDSELRDYLFKNSNEFVIPIFWKDGFYYVRKLQRQGNPQETVTFIVRLHDGILAEKYHKLFDIKGTNIYICDKHGNIVSSNQKQLCGKNIHIDSGSKGETGKILDQNKFLISSSNLNTLDMSIWVTVPKSSLYENISNGMQIYIIILVLISIIFITITILISLKLTSFLKDLNYCFNELKQRNYGIEMPPYRYDEFNNLRIAFNTMAGEIKYLIQEVYEKELMQKENEIKYLQSQINPHFLFNVLLTISTKARLNKDETVYRMVDALSELLRAGINANNGVTKIKVREELKYINLYLYLQKIRFEDKLNYEIEIEDERIYDMQIPKLSVEPIVENAVIHGLEPIIGTGLLTIRARIINDDLIFQIIDNGSGFDVEKIFVQQNPGDTLDNSSHSRIGLVNTNNRIKLIYGDKYGIFIKSERDKGTEVTIRFPADYGNKAS